MYFHDSWVLPWYKIWYNYKRTSRNQFCMQEMSSVITFQWSTDIKALKENSQQSASIQKDPLQKWYFWRGALSLWFPQLDLQSHDHRVQQDHDADARLKEQRINHIHQAKAGTSSSWFAKKIAIIVFHPRKYEYCHVYFCITNLIDTT